MSRWRVQARDREGTGWDDPPGKVVRGERRKGASAPGRLERELHPSRDAPGAVAAGKQGTGFGDPGGAWLLREGGWLRKIRAVM